MRLLIFLCAANSDYNNNKLVLTFASLVTNSCSQQYLQFNIITFSLT